MLPGFNFSNRELMAFEYTNNEIFHPFSDKSRFNDIGDENDVEADIWNHASETLLNCKYQELKILKYLVSTN